MIFKKNKFLCTILMLLFLCTWSIPAFSTDIIHESDAVPAPPSITVEASGALLLDADTGAVLFQQNADEQCYPASTTKIMTAYLTLKYGDPSAYYILPEGIYTGLDQYSSSAKLKTGEEVTVYELLECLLIASANEAANALACYVSGSVEAFVELMNEEALDLGCENTHFINPNGLHDQDHYTTARDLSKITLAALSFDTFREICAMTEATIPATNLSEERTLTTTNYLLSGSTHPEYSYDGALGVKTGFTTPAGYCLVSEATQDGRTLLSVVLGAKSTKSGTTETIGSFTESASLLSWGFTNYDAALQYESYLASLPEETPEPSPEPTPEDAETDAESSEEPETVAPVVTPEISQASSPSPSPSAAVSPAPSETSGSTVTLLSGLAEYLSISLQALLLSVAGVSALGLVLFLLLLVHLLRTRKE